MKKVGVKTIFCPWKKNWATREIPPVKIFLLHVKKNGKNPKKCPWNQESVRETSGKSVRESHFSSVKVEKRQKKAFTGTFDFHGKKKKTLMQHKKLTFNFDKCKLAHLAFNFCHDILLNWNTIYPKPPIYHTGHNSISLPTLIWEEVNFIHFEWNNLLSA